MSLQGKHILLGISAGIAAYKTPFLVRLLKKAGAEVKVIMTPSAVDFVTPLTLSTVSQNPVYVKPFDPTDGQWHSHVELALWADLFIIAPATANTMAKMVSGVTDNLLLATYLSSRSQVLLAPTMDLDMYKHPVTQRNIKALRELGHIILEPNTGELASGLEGTGRMQEPEELFAAIELQFKKKSELKEVKVLISAGPTYEKIDPVRFIGNHSSGKMGLALAESYANEGAMVTLIAGPGVAQIHHPNIHRIDIQSAEEIYESCMSAFSDTDICIMSAAIADFRPKNPTNQKIKKGNNVPTIELEPTKDVLYNLGQQKQANQLLIGFALETHDETANAKSKLERKNLDFIILNSMQDKGAGFGGDTNKIQIFDRSGEELNFELKTKSEVAQDIKEYSILKWKQIQKA